MHTRGRTTRSCPPADLPIGERYVQLEHLINAVWGVGYTLGFDLGRKPILTCTGSPIAPTSAILGSLARLFIEVLATFHMTGLSHLVSHSVSKLATAPTNTGFPCLQDLLDEPQDNDENTNDKAI